jgi:hypothetical protein
MATCGSAAIGKARCVLQLDARFRASLYAVFSVLFITGMAWLPADRLKSAAGGDVWSVLAPILLMLHGGAAMLAMMFLGALVPLHLLPAWHCNKNRALGVAMVAVTTLLIASAFGLYYIGSDTLRGWTSDLHIGLGLVFPALLIVHVATGRHRRSPLTLERSEALGQSCGLSDTTGCEPEMADDAKYCTSGRFAEPSVSCNRTRP